MCTSARLRSRNNYGASVSLRFEDSAVRAFPNKLEESELGDRQAIAPQLLAYGRLLLLGDASGFYFLTGHDVGRRWVQ